MKKIIFLILILLLSNNAVACFEISHEEINENNDSLLEGLSFTIKTTNSVDSISVSFYDSENNLLLQKNNKTKFFIPAKIFWKKAVDSKVKIPVAVAFKDNKTFCYQKDAYQTPHYKYSMFELNNSEIQENISKINQINKEIIIKKYYKEKTIIINNTKEDNNSFKKNKTKKEIPKINSTNNFSKTKQNQTTICKEIVVKEKKDFSEVIKMSLIIIAAAIVSILVVRFT
jgi:hypothetical protein